MATDEPLLKNLTRVWKVQELEGIDPNFTKAGSVSDKVIDFVQTCPMSEESSFHGCVPVGN